MSDSEVRLEFVGQLGEEFIERFRRGERPALTEYTDRFPEHASEIRELFPALAVMENLAPADQESLALPDSRPRPCAAPQLRQLGDYRIIREVGRGGMGVVYEAEQVSLGRHVALKVISSQMLRDPTVRQRFEREARAAARLHHTNIVPVFGVGEESGTLYYAMQFIQGLALDDVLAELKRLKADSPGSRLPGEMRIVKQSEALAADVARSLMTGRFAVTEALNAIAVAGGEPSPDRKALTEPVLPVTELEVHSPAATSSVATISSRNSETLRLSSNSAILPGISEVSSSGKSRQQTYWHSVARIGVQVADALQYAHDQGILHRDIKPSNLMLDLRGTVWVTDFGLAKADDAHNLTEQGDILGTLRYMPPEAFEGKTDARGDVYSLGLTLYELLAFQPAFHEKDRHKLIKLVTTSEAERIEKLNREVPRDLATIVHKAIDRDPAHRYRAARDLAADLQRFVDDVPIQARRISTVERASRWARRNKAAAVLIGAVVAVTLVGLIASTALWRQADQARSIADKRAASEKLARQEADRERRKTRLTLADTYTSFGLAAGERDDPRQAVLWFAHAAKVASDDQERSEANRIRAAAWGRLAIQPLRAFVHPAEQIEKTMSFHPGGRHLLTHAFDPDPPDIQCRLWDLTRESPLPFPGNSTVVSAAAWDATGERLAVGTPLGDVTICRFPSGESLHRLSFAGRISRLLFSPDGCYLALSAANRARVWGCEQAAFVTPELKHPAPIEMLVFHPLGELLATGCADQKCRVFAVPAEQSTPLYPPVPHLGKVASLTTRYIPPHFLDQGRGLLTVSRGEAVERDPRTGHALRTIWPFDESGTGRIEDASVSTNGIHLLLAGRSYSEAGSFTSQSHVRVYDVASAQPVSPELEHRALQMILCATFSPNGAALLTGSGDRTVRMWSVPDGNPLGGPLMHSTSVHAVAYAPDGRQFVTAQRGGLIRLWALPGGNPRDYRASADTASFVRLSPDGRFLLPAGANHNRGEMRSTRVFDLATGEPAGATLEANGIILDAALSPDGKQMAAAVSSAASAAERSSQWKETAKQSGQLVLWDLRAGQRQQEPLVLPSEPRKLDYSADGREIVVLCARGELVVVDPATGSVLRQWLAHAPHLRNGNYINNGTVRYSPDNRKLLTFGTDANSLRIFDALTGHLERELHHMAKCHDVQFSSDGRLVATASWDDRVRVWELATGKQLARLDHPDWTHTAHFSPDGQQLLTACRDGMARLWDWRAGRLVCPPFEHDHEVHAVAFTPNGRHVLSASDDGVLKIWEWRTGKLVCPPLTAGGAILNLAVTPDGKRVVCGGFMKDLPIFCLDDWLTPSSLDSDDLCLWGEIVAGQRVEDGGGVTNLTTEEWLERWQAFRQRQPE